MIKLKDLINEKVIKPDVSFVKKILDDHKDLLAGDYSADYLASALEILFDKHKIEFVLSSGSKSQNKLLADVGIVSGSVTTDGKTIRIYLSDKIETGIKNKFDTFVKALSIIIGHELVHRGQLGRIKAVNPAKFKEFMERMKSIDPYSMNLKDYLSGKQEIMAFAQEFISDLKQKNFSNQKIFNILKNPSSYIKKSFILNVYMQTFDLNEPVMKRFLKQSWEYADND
jgi:hypothetical protein